MPAQKCKILQACGHNTEVKSISRFTCRNIFFERSLLHDIFFLDCMLNDFYFLSPWVAGNFCSKSSTTPQKSNDPPLSSVTVRFDDSNSMFIWKKPAVLLMSFQRIYETTMKKLFTEYNLRWNILWNRVNCPYLLTKLLKFK